MSIREGCVGKAECNEGSSAAVTRESFMGNLGIGSSWLNFFERNFKKETDLSKADSSPWAAVHDAAPLVLRLRQA